jgi:hypothetical protein
VLVGAGDIAGSGSGDEETAQLLDQVVAADGASVTVFTAGDNAYPDGTPSNFTDYYEPTWGRHKARTRPSPGNHDYHTAGAAGYFDYFGANAGDPGVGYYGYDVGEWHIISLNSEISMSAGSAQEQWLRADLAATTKPCVLAYWHKPRFSSANHGSSTGPRALWQALYDYKAEVVVAGHDHTYERFALQDPDGNADQSGIRQFVVGTGGRSLYSFGSPEPNSEVRYDSTFGVIKFTLSAGSYTWEFMPVSGTFSDSGSGTCQVETPGAASGTTSEITASPTSIVADGSATATITVQLKDANGINLTMGGDAVSLTTTLGALSDVTDQGDGTYAATLTAPTTPGTATVTGTVNQETVTDDATVTFTGVASGATSEITASPTSIVADGSATATITVQLKDANGANLTTGGDQVTLATTLGALSAVTDQGNGTYTATLTAVVTPGTATVTGTVNGEAITDGAVVTFTEPAMTVDVRVAASTDDGEERADRSMYLTSSDLELVYDGGDQTVGMRFTGVAIPQGASINNAYVQFQVDETPSDPTFLTIHGAAADNAATFGTADSDISNRDTTDAAVTWTPAPWPNRGQAGPDQQTPDIASIIQEIVNRPGWASGNALVIIITGTGERVAESYDGDSSAAPLLHVDYSLGWNTAPLASFTYGCTDLTCSFSDTSTDPDGTVVTRSWEFGDGATSSDLSPIAGGDGDGSEPGSPGELHL